MTTTVKMPVTRDEDLELSRFLGECAGDPLKFVRRAYRWGKGELAGCDGPRRWQAEVLAEIGAQLRRGRATPVARHDRVTGVTRPQQLPIRIAVASGHGIGKSALVAWLAQWGLATMGESRVVVTANTGAQLQTKTWPEMAKWYNRLICRHWFRLGAASLYSRAPELRDTWRIDKLTWSERNSEAFAGLHNAGKRIVVLYDEASTIADRIWEVTEGALTDADTEIVWVAFGNPTRNSGRFHDCFGRHRDLWTHRQIDSRAVEGANRALAAQWVETWGEDSDFVRVRVRGEFPRSGSLQFIASDVVDEAMARELPRMPGYTQAQPLVLGVDVARFGDDCTVIQPRRGLDARSLPALSFRGLDTMQVAARVMEAVQTWRAAAVFVDEGGVGAGVVDRLRQLRCPGLEGVNFGGRATSEHARYANKRAEIWGTMRDWLRTGAIAGTADLKADLTGVEYGYNMRDEIQLEAKDDMKARGMASPDLGDALALTFAWPVGHLVEAPREEPAYYAGQAGYNNRKPHMMPDNWQPYGNDGDDY